MTYYILDCIKKLEDKFDLIGRILLQNYIYHDKTTADVVNDMENLPPPLQQKYRYLIEDHMELLSEDTSIKEFVMKISISVNFMNGHDLIQYMVEKYSGEVELKYATLFLGDIRKILSHISLSDFAETWVASVPKSCADIVFELDDHWKYKSLEDLRNLHLHYPHKYWHFKQVINEGDALKIIYALPKSTRLYQIEQHSLKLYDITSVQVFGEKILDFSPITVSLFLQFLLIIIT